jgi:nitrate reductase gamma subunit
MENEFPIVPVAICGIIVLLLLIALIWRRVSGPKSKIEVNNVIDNNDTVEQG